MTEYKTFCMQYEKLYHRALEILDSGEELYKGEYQHICDEASVVFSKMMNAKFKEQESLYGTRA